MSWSFTLRQLQYFVAVAEAGSLTAAAAHLHVSQPGLSQSLTDLERALDAQLAVRRKAHGVTLTATGRQVLRLARDLLRQADDVEASTRGRHALTGHLSLGCYVTFAPSVVPPMLQGFARLHPEVVLDVTEGTQDVLQARLLNGELELAMLYDMELRPEMDRLVLREVRPHVLLPADHRLAGADAVALVDLEDEPMALLDAPPSSHNTLRIFQHLGLRPRVTLRPTTYELTRSLVGLGLAYSLLVQRPATDVTYEGHRVVVKEIAEDVPPERMVLCWPRHVRLSRRAQEFVRWCRAGTAARGGVPPQELE